MAWDDRWGERAHINVEDLAFLRAQLAAAQKQLGEFSAEQVKKAEAMDRLHALLFGTNRKISLYDIGGNIVMDICVYTTSNVEMRIPFTPDAINEAYEKVRE